MPNDASAGDVPAAPAAPPAPAAPAAPAAYNPGAGDEPPQKIVDRLWAVFNGLTEVRVFTLVTDVPVEVTTVNKKTEATFEPTQPNVPAFITIFNLIDGDVINVIPDTLKANTELRAFHAAQVDKSLKVVPDNIEALVKLGKAIIDEFP